MAALHAAITGVHLQCGGPTQMVWLPGETIKASTYTVNISSSAVQATLQWSIVGSAGAMPQPVDPNADRGGRRQRREPEHSYFA